MKRNKFSLSHYKLLSCDMGELVPVSLTEVLPGDTIQQATSALIRVSPLLAPVMHPVQVRIHHWYVPHRLIWEDWEDFITGGPDGFDAAVFPTINMTYTNPTTGNNLVGQLPDYLGIPPGVNNVQVSALPFRAYAKIWNEFYRDQDLQTELGLSEASGSDATTNVALQNVAWEKDYFTSARPWTQKGPEVTIPLVGDAPVIGLGKTNATFGGAQVNLRESTGAQRNYAAAQVISGANANESFYVEEGDTGYPNIRADLSGVSAASINDLRLAFALQRYEEARARYGSRYTEYLRYLGVRSSDARLQRPEYLGGGKQTLQFSEVLQTGTATPETTPLGTMKGHGIGAVRSNRYRKFFEEHGYVMTLMSVKPKTMYVQGISRTWNRRTKEDFWQRELEHIGQQEIDRREIWAPSVNTTPFGYQDRYDEYRRTESGVSGEFRTTALDYWHMARIFSSEPELNASFVASNPTKRVNAVQTNDVLWCMTNHSIQARRQLSATGKSFIF